MTCTLAPGSTTAIGSLPHANAEEAVEFVFNANLDVPFWPQLPRRNYREWMVPQYAADLPGFTLDDEQKKFRIERGDDFVDRLTAFYERVIDPEAQFPLRDEFAAGYFAFLKRTREGEGSKWLKGQVTGPLTFILGLNTEDGRPINADEELKQAGLQAIARNAAWQTKQLNEAAGETSIVFMDEPIYSALGTASYLSIKAEDVTSTVNEVARAVHGAGGLAGIHLCGSADWETVLATEIDIFNFDAWNYTSSVAVHSGPLTAFLQRGGHVAWGIVPTSEDIDHADEGAVVAKLTTGFEEITSRGVDAKLLYERSIFTPSCGCGSLTVEQTRKVFRLLGTVREHWRQKSV